MSNADQVAYDSLKHLFHPLENIPHDLQETIGVVKLRARREWASQHPDLIVGQVLVGSQEAIELYASHNICSVWMIMIYPTAGDMRLHNLCLTLPDGHFDGWGTYETDMYLDFHGGLRYCISLIGQSEAGLVSLGKYTIEPDPVDLKEKRRAWVPNTLAQIQARLSQLMRSLDFEAPGEPNWTEGQRQILELYSGLNALEMLCYRHVPDEKRYAAAATYSLIPCTFPIGDENGTGGV